jgi:hypothetical protein
MTEKYQSFQTHTYKPIYQLVRRLRNKTRILPWIVIYQLVRRGVPKEDNVSS